MTSEFYFSLARLSCLHIFRAAGIDRCSPQLLDAITDIVIRHLDLLATKCTRNAQLSGRNLVEIQDVALAMEQIGLIYPRSILDPFDTDVNSIKGFNEFIDWAKGPVPEQTRRMAKQAIPEPAIATIGSANTTGVTSVNITGITRANTTAAIRSANITAQDMTMTTETEQTENKGHLQSDWLANLARKRVKVGQEKRFKGTVLASILGDEDEEVQPDVKIVGGPTSMEDFYDKFYDKFHDCIEDKDHIEKKVGDGVS